MSTVRRLCLNWKVLAGVVMVALVIARVEPRLLGAALPVLLVAICPLSMLLMMRGMRGMGGMHSDQSSGESEQAGQSTTTPLPPSGQLAALKGQLARLQAEADAIGQQIHRLEAAGEGVARASDPAVDPGEAQLVVPLGAPPRD